jgi:hypothetical protein
MQTRQTGGDGSVLVWTILTVAVLSLAAAEVLRVTSAKYQNALHTATWQESLLGAESGIDLAVMELRKSLYPAPNHAWDAANGWDTGTSNGVTTHSATLPQLAGTSTSVQVNVDAPPQLIDPANGWQGYRVRTMGTLPISGLARADDNKQDTRLRKLSLTMERFTGGALQSRAFAVGETPHVSRRTEAILRPVSAFDQAIMAVGALDLTDQDIIIDSYDSRDKTKSTDPGPDGVVGTADDGTGPGPDRIYGTADDGAGRYDVTKRQQNGDIATDGQILNAGNAHVYGDASTNSGTATGVANVTGLQRDDFYQEPIPIAAPSWPSINPSPALVNGTVNLPASSTEGARKAFYDIPLDSVDAAGAAVSRYSLSSITMSGNQVLTLTGNADGSPAYVEIYITGDVSATGNAQVILSPGVKAKIYFNGNFNIAGNGVVNTNNQPGDLLFYGVNPPDNVSRTFALGGNSVLSAAVYAPGYDVQINNGGTRGSVYGSFVGKTVKMNGVTDLHYDEALGSGGTVNNYRIVSWFEDTR